MSTEWEKQNFKNGVLISQNTVNKVQIKCFPSEKQITLKLFQFEREENPQVYSVIMSLPVAPFPILLEESSGMQATSWKIQFSTLENSAVFELKKKKE